jgi:hypothetical protein
MVGVRDGDTMSDDDTLRLVEAIKNSDDNDILMLVEALAFYADTDTYCAIGIFPDPPCGDFINDFDEHKKPGARARKTLRIYFLKKEFKKILHKIDKADINKDKNEAAQLHEERRRIKNKLKKLGVEVTS